MQTTVLQSTYASKFALLKSSLLALSFATLAACGGGGGGGGGEPDPNTPDTTAPSIVSFNPQAGATIGSETNKRPVLSIKFSEAVKNVNSTNISLTKAGKPPKSVDLDIKNAQANTYTFTPMADLEAGASYTLTIKKGITDTAGNALVADISKSYTAYADKTPPKISSMDPSVGSAIGNASNKKPSISVTFSENVSNVNKTNVLLKKGSKSVDITITNSGKTYTITPDVDLVSGESYVLEFNAGIKDAAGNALVAVTKNYTAGDMINPTVSITPANSATDIALDADIKLTFSEAVKGVTPTNVKISKLANGSNAVTATISNTGNVYSVDPSADLDPNTKYYLLLSGITDAQGNALIYANPISFTTVDAPVVRSITPANTAAVQKRQAFVVSFSKPVKNVNASNVTLVKKGASNSVALSIASGSNNQYTVTPTADLDSNATYTLTIKKGITGTSSANVPVVEKSMEYRVVDYVKPTVSSFLPRGTSLGDSSDRRPTLEVRFSEDVKNVNKTNVAFTKVGSSAPINYTVRRISFSIYWVSFGANLDDSSSYKLSLKSGITDNAGNALAPVTKDYTTSDWTAPTISSTNPANGATGVGNAASKKPTLRITFSEDLSGVRGRRFSDGFKLTKGNSSTAIGVTIGGSGSSYTVIPNGDLEPKTVYKMHFNSRIRDVAGNRLASTVRSFTTGDFTPPTVTSVSPANAATNVDTRASVVVEFSENVSGVSTSSVQISTNTNGTNAVNMTMSPTTANAKRYTFTPASGATFTPGATYYIVIHKNQITDGSNNLTGYTVKRFTTALLPSKLGFRALMDGTKSIFSFDSPMANTKLLSYRNSPCNLGATSNCGNFQSQNVANPTTVTAFNTTNDGYMRIKSGNTAAGLGKENVFANSRLEKRAGNRAAYFKGRFWLIGGTSDINNGGILSNDIFYSTDGRHWKKAPASSSSNVRFRPLYQHQVVVHDNKLYVIGGRMANVRNNASSGSGGLSDTFDSSEVWSSFDGIGWTKVNAATAAKKFTPRSSHVAISYNNALFVIGGRSMRYRNSHLSVTNMKDVYFSTNGGRDWTKHTTASLPSALSGHQAAVLGTGANAKVVITGGYNASLGRESQDTLHFNGQTITKANANSQFGARQGHAMVNFKGKLWVNNGTSSRYDPADMFSSTDGITWTRENTANIRASFGTIHGHQMIVAGTGSKSKLWMIGARDSGDVYSSDDAKNWKNEPQYKLPKLYAHQIVEDTDNKVLYLIGGRKVVTGSNAATNDVYKSTDGVNWQKVAVKRGFSARQDHQAAYFDRKLWVIAGRGSSGALKDVWSSSDGGVNWRRVQDNAPFDAIYGHQVVVANFDRTGNKLWLFGGRKSSSTVASIGGCSPTFSSNDGVTWRSGPRFCSGGTVAIRDFPHAEHQVVQCGSTTSVLLIGGRGGNNGYTKEVYSFNGSTFTKVNVSSGFYPTSAHHVSCHKNEYWLTAGWVKNSAAGINRAENWVYKSTDGQTWNRQSDVSPVKFFEHQTYSFKGHLYLMGGAKTGTQVYNHIWQLNETDNKWYKPYVGEIINH